MPTYEPFDQGQHLPEPPWPSDLPALRAWEDAHGHDVRLKCYPEFGCQVIGNDLQARIDAGLRFHTPVRVCVAHHQEHECPENKGYLYRCFECAKTRLQPCRTWQALTGQEKPAPTDREALHE